MIIDPFEEEMIEYNEELDDYSIKEKSCSLTCILTGECDGNC